MTERQTNKTCPHERFVHLLQGYAAFNSHFVVAILLVVLVVASANPKTVLLGVVVPYYAWTLTLGRHELRDGNHWHRFSKQYPVFRAARQYLRMKLIADSSAADSFGGKNGTQRDTDPHEQKPQQFIFAVFPHGAYADYRVIMDGMLDTVLPPSVASRTRTLTATVLFRIPLVREIALWTGCVDARRSVAERLLERGRSLVVLPGGEMEQIMTQYGNEEVYLKNRKGFIKLAMRHGVAVVPVYVFGVSDYYKTSSFFLPFRVWLVKTLGIGISFNFGLFGSMGCPFPVNTTAVFGKPIRFARDNDPSLDALNAAHQRFCASLVELFDRHKKELGYGDRTLEIL